MENSKLTGYAPVNGLNMYYEIHGEGEIPLVLIHGGGSTIETSFGEFLPLLSPHMKVIAVEMQAHGRTSDRDAPESYKQDAADVAALMKYLNIEKANILGFSDGGCTTMQIAMSYPAILSKIVVVSSNYKNEGMIPEFAGFMKNASLENMPEPLKVAYNNVAPDKSKLIVMFNKDRDRRLGYQDWEDADLKSIKTPALLMVADKDVVTVEHVVKMSHLIPNAQLTVLPGTHGSFIGEICTAKKGSRLPEMAAVLVREFLWEM
ncbi:alpha/beta fold hydrolase [Dyadobacter sp. CY323]|uniref:alpha/beta fold hydrolase n=1 Tax=Dyadobacter sp. CY323 TaxID=2907302 RepID=UPI001F210517|nr:alpha/beta hydrolase [Dyadobacter sp. CY323]MCE6991860.1 alpha/beta hydrolase [Dyadobacter sp. CY323]